MTESWLSRSLFTNFSFSRRNLGYHGAFHEVLFFTMESWLSRSLSRTSLFHDGILAITEPFTNFSFFTMESWLSRILFTNHGGILAIKEPFHESRWNSGYQGAFSHDKVHKCTNWGKSSFIYITKSIYIGFASL
jgi:hypothetical protein